jgi:hypothetical protein
LRRTIFITACLSLFSVVKAANDPYAKLMLYNGGWDVTHKNSAKPDKLQNQCATTGHFFVCDQSVNGGPSALLIFIPRADKPGEYYTQNIRPEGRATSRGDLLVSGDTWTFLSNWNDSGHTIYYRTVNTFVSRTHIHYEQSESTNNKDWKITNTGDETKVAGKR